MYLLNTENRSNKIQNFWKTIHQNLAKTNNSEKRKEKKKFYQNIRTKYGV